MTTIRMPFGRHRGRRLTSLPDGYVLWLRSLDLLEPLRTAVALEYWRRFPPPPIDEEPAIPSELRDLAAELVHHGYRVLAKRVHPDAGGSDAEMRRLNETAEALRRLVAGDTA